MWWVDAIDLGLYDPLDPPMSVYDNPEARDYMLRTRYGVEYDYNQDQ